MTPAQTLAQPFTLPCGVVIPNRIAKSAMSEALGDASGSPKPGLANLYRQWAEGGLGLCITGNVMIDRRALGEPGNVVIEDDRNLAQLKAWAAAGTANGRQLWMQINHPGKQAPKGLNAETVSPSAVPFRKDMAALFALPRELTDAEIHDIIRRYGVAAQVAQQAGFTGVQIHGAHGYLVSQFLSPHHNRREDAWGGTPEKRRAFVLAVYAAMRAQVGNAFPIGIKLNSADFQKGGFTEEESLQCISALSDAGIDLIEISGGTYEAPEMTGVNRKASTVAREAYFLEFAEKVRKTVHIPLMVTGGFRTVVGMKAALDSGALDFIGVARSLALEPDLPNRLLKGLNPQHSVQPIRTYIPMVERMGIMEIVWYTRQLHRMAGGKAPRPKESGLKVFAGYALSQMLGGHKPKKLRATN